VAGRRMWIGGEDVRKRSDSKLNPPINIK